jgi:hypothetical protein
MTGVLVAMGKSSEEASTSQKISNTPPAVTKAPHTPASVPVAKETTKSRVHCDMRPPLTTSAKAHAPKIGGISPVHLAHVKVVSTESRVHVDMRLPPMTSTKSPPPTLQR